MTATLNRCAPKSPQTELPTPRILCVDDDPDFHTNLELRLRNYDVEVERAFYGMQGIVEATSLLPDLIIMDQAMPNGDGEYLLSCIKRNSATANIPVIALTGMRDPEVRSRLLCAGADVFLNKPVHFDELMHHISRFIDVRDLADEGNA